MSDPADPSDDEPPWLRGLAHDAQREVHELGEAEPPRGTASTSPGSTTIYTCNHAHNSW